MAQQMYKHDALLHLVWTVAICSKERGMEKWATPEEDAYLELIRKTENITIDWGDFNAKRKELGWQREIIIDEACKALRGCGKEWRIKCVGYMKRMAWVSWEGAYIDDEPMFQDAFRSTMLEKQNISDAEWKLILRAQKELGLTDNERENAHKVITHDLLLFDWERPAKINDSLVVNKVCCIMNEHYSIDIPNSNLVNGQSLQIWQNHGGDNQKWKINEDGTIVSIMDNNFCIDIPNSNLVNGQSLQIWQNHGGDNQKWKINEDGTIVSVMDNNFCIDIPNSNLVNGQSLQIWKNHGGDNQKFITNQC